LSSDPHCPGLAIHPTWIRFFDSDSFEAMIGRPAPGNLEMEAEEINQSSRRPAVKKQSTQQSILERADSAALEYCSYIAI
jgi:hypothetical protein